MKSFLLKLINGYENTGLGKHFVSLSYSGSVSSKNRKRKGRKLYKIDERISSFFAATRSTCYGAFFISLGLSVLLFYFLNEYAGKYEGRNITTFTLGVACAIISVPLLLVDKPWHRVVSESRILDYVLFEFFCMKRGWSPEDSRGAPTVIGVIFGVLVGAIGIFVPVANVMVVLGAILLVYLSFSSPEFPYLLSLLIIPYSSYIPHASVVLSFLAILSITAFFKKAFSGKRVVNIEQYDVLLFVLLTLVCIYLGFWVGNAKAANYFIVVSSFIGFFLSSNVITNRRLADTISNGLVITTLPLLIYNDVIMIISLAGGIQTPALSPEFLASAVVCALLSLRLIKHSSGAAKAAYLILLSVYLLSVGLMMHPLCTAALLVGILTALLYRAGKYFPLLTLPVCLVASLLHLIPEPARAGVYSFLRIDPPTLAERLFSSPIGIAIFAVAVLLLVIRARHRIVYWRFFEGTHLTSISVGYAGSAVALMLMLGIGSDMLTGFTFYLLLCIFGMGSAALRVAKSESDNEELYFEDSKSTDSSTVNVLIH